MTYPNGVQSTFTYDAQYRLTQMPIAKGATQVARYDYTVSPSGQRLTAVERSGRSVAWSYDNGWRMTGETVASDPGGRNGALTYSLHASGNRLSRSSTLAALGAQTFSYNADDQLAGETYDGNGNTIASGGKTFVYDFENRLKSVNGGAVVMGYDGDGNRVSKTVGGVTTKYLVDDLNPTGYAQVLEEIVGGAVQRVYAHGLQRISQSQLVGGTWQTTFYGYDSSDGSVRQLYDAAGAVTDTYDYDAFGSVIVSTGTTANAYRYRGEQFDSDAGLYYLRARWYNPATGRFLTRDPAEGVLDRPASLNPYVYAEADPVNKLDPSGLAAAPQYPPGYDPTPAPGGRLTFLAYYLQTVVIPIAERFIIPTVYYYGPYIPAGVLAVNQTSWSVLCVFDGAGSLLDIAAQGQSGQVVRRGCRFEVQPRSEPDNDPEPKPKPRSSEPEPKELCRGRIQAQGGGLEKSVPWARPTAPSSVEGLAMLAELKSMLTKRELSKRSSAFMRAEKWIGVTCPSVGGCWPQVKAFYEFPGSPSSDPNSDLRVDVEIKSCQTFK